MSVALILLALAISTYFLKCYSKFSEFFKKVKSSQSLKGPGFRELFQQLQKGDILYWLLDLRNRYGSIFRVWFGPDLSIFLTDPEDVKIVLSSSQNTYTSKSYKLLEPWLGKGLLTSSGDLWQTRRRMLTPAFHFKMLGEFKQPIEDNCNILIKKLEKEANCTPFNIYPFMTLIALDIVCETAMGIKKNAQLQSESEYVTSVHNACRLFHRQTFSSWKRIQWLYKFTEDFKQRKHHLKFLHDETNRVIEMRRKALKESNITTIADAEGNDEYGGKRRLAFLDILLLAQEDGADLTDSDIREEVDTFMLEGHDTTSAAISFALYSLSQNQAEQQKVYEEVVAMKGKENEHLPYLEAVIKETLRLYPSVPFFKRNMTEDVMINNLRATKGTSVFLLAFVMHRDEKYFPEPEKFNPQRFLVDETKLHPYAYIPFSAGPRNCIGQKFAMLVIKCVLANVLRAYEFLPVEGFVPQPFMELGLKSGNGLCMKLRKR